MAGYPISVTAQEYRGRVQGVVSDESGAVVPDATVVLANNDTGVASTKQSDLSGRYLFDLVPPGNYTVEIVAVGFAKSIHEGVLVQARGDVTVDSMLRVSATQESIVVTEAAGQVEFNSVKAEITLDTKLVQNLPNFGRNPFLLATIDPSVQKTRDEIRPQDSWGSNAIRIAGSQEFSNDLQVDGSPITLGLKGSYVPNTEAIQEVNIQANAVDAEFGNSSGGIVSIALKSGTNEFHGVAWYLGRYPWANALEDRHYRTINTSRQHSWGIDLGNPILKNKLFNYFSYEHWNVTAPGSLSFTTPTADEINGNFSNTKLIDGSPTVIYDPFSTRTDANNNVTRTPFPGAIIPQSQQDPIARKLLGGLNLAPNRPGDDPTGLNNWAAAAPERSKYWNITDRADYFASEKLRFTGRGSRFVDTDVTTNPTGSPLYATYGAGRESYQLAGTMTYTLSPRTVIDVHGSWHSLVDEVIPPQSKPGFDWQDLYTGQEGLLKAIELPGLPSPNRPPRIQISRGLYDDLISFGDYTGYWYSHPEGHAIHGKLLHNRGSHFLKFGGEYRYQYGKSIVMYNSGFNAVASSTNATYISPDLRTSGNGYASFLTGAIGDPDDNYSGWGAGSNIHQDVVKTPISRFWSFYANDDWKITRNLTLSLGLRYEYELPWSDPQNRGSRGVDLTQANPTLSTNPPQIDGSTLAEVRRFYSGPLNLTNGVWQYSSGDHPGMWNPHKTVFLPRVGVAYRLNEKTAIRGAFARWAHPWVSQGYGQTGSLLDVVYPGFSQDQQPLRAVQGVPQVTLSDPFPSTSPIIPAVGQGYGPNYGLGTDALYWYQDRPKDISDRINFGVDRQLPYGFVGKITYFLNFSRDLAYTSLPNAVDPMLNYQHKGALNVQVPNPFYLYGTPETFPGGLRYQETVGITQLMRPYPQYTNLRVDYTPGRDSRYQALQIQVRRPFRDGLSLLFAYNYNYETSEYFYDDVAQYNERFDWIASANARHGLTLAASWEVPVGKGRRFLASLPKGLDYVLGGWTVSPLVTWRSGRFARFGGLLELSDPRQNVPEGAYFNPKAFDRLPAYTRRTNQNLYPGITGPGYFNLDTTLNKDFVITEALRLRLDIRAYNALNGFTISDPVTNITSSQFGYSPGTQAGGTFGRRTEFGLKVLF